MKLDPKTLLLGGLALAGLLIVGEIVMISMASTKADKLGKTYQGKLKDLDSRAKRKPYPSERNLKLETENIDLVRGNHDDLRSALSTNQTRSKERNPASFLDAWKKVRVDLTKSAKSARVGLPADSPFGFDYYLKGDVPIPDHVPRMMDQLHLIEELVELLYDSNVRKIGSVSREAFELPAEAISRRTALVNPLAGVVQTNELFGSFVFRLQFTANQEAFMNVLNSLASRSRLTRVSSVSGAIDIPSYKKVILEEVDGGGAELEDFLNTTDPSVLDGSGDLPAEPKSKFLDVHGRTAAPGEWTLDVEVFMFAEEGTP